MSVLWSPMNIVPAILTILTHSLNVMLYPVKFLTSEVLECHLKVQILLMLLQKFGGYSKLPYLESVQQGQSPVWSDCGTEY